METRSQTQPLSHSPAYKRVLDVLATLRRRDTVRCVLGGLGRVLAFLVAALLVRCALDYWLQFSWTARAALLAADLVVVGWIFWRFFWTPFKRRLTRDGAALRLQARAPVLQSRLIATVQLVPEADAGTAPRALVNQLLMETAPKLGTMDWKQAVPLRQSLAWMFAAVWLAALGAAWAMTYTSVSGVLVSRYFLSARGPVLQTQLEVSPGDAKLARGSDILLSAVTSGEVPREVVVQIIDRDGGLEDFTVRPQPDDSQRFELMVENPQASFSYRVFAGDATSREFDVEVLVPPSLRELNFEVTPPAYTGMASYTASANNFRLVEGASLAVSGVASDPLRSASIDFYTDGAATGDPEVVREVPLKIGADERSLQAEIAAVRPEAASLAVELVGERGVVSVDNTRYPIDWIMDLEPEIEFEIAPADGGTIAGGRSVRIAGRITEDHGLEGVRFCYQVRSETEEAGAKQSVPIDVTGTANTFDFRFVAGVPRERDTIGVRANPGATVIWWIEATDNSALSDGPHVSESTHIQSRVVTAEDKIAELMGRVREGMSTIEQVSDRQMEAGTRLKQLLEATGEGNPTDSNPTNER